MGAAIGEERAPHAGSAAPTWTRVSEIPSCVGHRPHLQRTVATALVVGTVLFLLNHLDAVVRGRVGTGVWVATGISFVVPFLVANTGLLVALRRPGTRADGRPRAGRRRPSAATPTWARLVEVPRCIVHRRHLVRTAGIALVVGSVYFVVNQLGTVVSGDATISTWVASGATYLVPFSVSNLGILVGTRRPPSAGAPRAPARGSGRLRATGRAAPGGWSGRPNPDRRGGVGRPGAANGTMRP